MIGSSGKSTRVVTPGIVGTAERLRGSPALTRVSRPDVAPTVGSVTRELTIEARGLKKSYGDFEAVKGVDIEVSAGEVVGFLGPNGAGKTTTVEVLEGYRPPTEGLVRVLGMDPATGGRALRERIGIVLQEAGFLMELTVQE